MARRPKSAEPDTVELLRDILIVQLGVAGVQQQKIRAIIGCDINRVSRIVRHLKVKSARKEP
jgi:hypothetical protein